MSSWQRSYYKLLNVLLNVLVKSRSIPIKPTLELGLDTSRPIIYVLPYNSKIDLLILRNQCLAHNLPDPIEPLKLNNNILLRYTFIHKVPRVFTNYYGHKSKNESINVFHKYLNLHRSNPDLDAQIVPVSVMFGRCPGRQKTEKNQLINTLNGIQKFFAILWFGRDSFVCFSQFISLRRIIDKYDDTDKIIVQKLVRMACTYFVRQHLATVGPRLHTRQDMLNKLLASKAITRAVEDEARSKKHSYEKAQQSAIAIIEEIAANTSYEMIRLFDRILGFTWNLLYQEINVHNIEHVRHLVHDGYEIVYVPCHRSHIDYLLLSYILYQQGLVPPHIAAGINLNFWPAGPIFRRLGAFFIRRAFKSNKLYSTVFREYLGELFSHGHSVEYFIEGGRSRTGRLLDPKTGTLSMTIQAVLRGDTRPIALLPIYIGYEHIVEVNSYTKELRGEIKEKESFPQILRSLRKLHNLGHGYVNFGEPIQLMTWLDHQVPEWRESIDPITTIRPVWFTPIVNSIATEIMIRINNAGAANAVNLCCTALLASSQHSLAREQLTEQLECYLSIMRNVPYSANSTIPKATATQLIDHALQMKKFEIEKDVFGDIIILPREQVVLMTYYRNNIVHMFILPSMLATITTQHRKITRQELFRHVEIFYPMLKSELFLRWSKEELYAELDKIIAELLRQSLLTIKDEEISINPARSRTLKLLAASAYEALQRYAITFWLLSNNPSINRETLEKKSCMLAKRLSVLHGNNAPEFFDKAIFSSLILVLRNEGYIKDTEDNENSEIIRVYQMLVKLISSDVLLTIESIT